MRIEPASGRVLAGPLQPVYVYEAPVRIWHWVMMICMLVLAATGYLIGSPLPAIGGEAYDTYFFAWVRIIHLSTAWIFTVAFVVRMPTVRKPSESRSGDRRAIACGSRTSSPRHPASSRST